MVVSGLPLIAKAMPARLTVYMFLAIAILCAMWMSARTRGASDHVAVKWLAGALIALSLLPSLDASF